MPTLVLFLARMGVITPRFLIRNIKYAILIIVIVAAVLSPGRRRASAWSRWPGPMILLYVFSIGLAWVFGKKKRRPRHA